MNHRVDVAGKDYLWSRSWHKIGFLTSWNSTV